MQLFQKVQMASEDVKSYLGTGVFYKENKEFFYFYLDKEG